MSFVQPSAKLSLCVFVLCNLRLFVFQLQKWKKLKRVYCFALCAASKRLRCPTCQSVLKLTVARLFIHLFDAWLFHLRVMVWNWNWLRLKICLIFHTVISHKKKKPFETFCLQWHERYCTAAFMSDCVTDMYLSWDNTGSAASLSCNVAIKFVERAWSFEGEIRLPVT